MTQVTELTGNDARVTINGIVVGLSDFSLSVKGGVISQPRVGYSTPRKLPGIKDVDIKLTNIDIDGDMFALAMADALPTCARLVVADCDASTNWTASGTDVISVETAITNSGTGSIKVACAASDPSGNTVIFTVTDADLSTAHVLEFWIRSTKAGTIGTFGFGEGALTGASQAVTIKKADTWQREVIFLADISSAVRNAVTQVGFTFGSATVTDMTSQTIYIDNINALTGFTFGKGQYFTLTATCKHPTDPTKYVDVFVPDAFLTSGEITFGDASKVIEGPTSGSVKDASKVIISYS